MTAHALLITVNAFWSSVLLASLVQYAYDSLRTHERHFAFSTGPAGLTAATAVVTTYAGLSSPWSWALIILLVSLTLYDLSATQPMVKPLRRPTKTFVLVEVLIGILVGIVAIAYL